MRGLMSYTEQFASRHIGPDQEELNEMLRIIGADSLDSLMKETIPSGIWSKTALDLPEGISEYQFLQELSEIVKKNRIMKSFIGLGYHDCITPTVLLRNILENPSWYTPYTPYQSEIAQGRLEALLNYQTMVCDLTGMEVANASLLDEGTAAAEAVSMLYRLRSREKVKKGANVFFLASNCFPQTIEIIKTRAEPLGMDVVIDDPQNADPDDRFFGALIQYPTAGGGVFDYSDFVNRMHKSGALVAVAADLLSLVLLRSPIEFDADVAVGSSQRFGVPMGFGGPHAAFFATRETYKRQMPGRIIGVSVDRNGNKAYRMALQTREQHIRRESATSNICTAQSLLAVMAGMYAVYHGPAGLESIARRIHAQTMILAHELTKLGYEQKNDIFFDTIEIGLTEERSGAIKKLASQADLNFRFSQSNIGISIGEPCSPDDIRGIIAVFATAAGKEIPTIDQEDYSGLQVVPDNLARTSSFLTHAVFNTFHSETEMMRYIRRLEQKDIGLNTSMIPLGSCTMKLNAATEMIPVTWPGFSRIHPFAPPDQTTGYNRIIEKLTEAFQKITGLHSVSFQPNSGAQGEYTSLLTIRAYHKDNGQAQRNLVLIPASAHGTNPASAAMAGMRVTIVKCDEMGNIDLDDLREKAIKNKDSLAAIMITYPSTHGVFEEKIQEVCSIVHENGGQVFLDGANMNALVGLTTPAAIGADACHLNLHKTFSIPHGGGGPGMGPICVAEHLAPFLPGHALVKVGGGKAISSVAAAPWGSASILLVSYGYIRMLGGKGMTAATQYAILNANYLKSRLEKFYDILYTGKEGRVAHEMIFDLRQFKSQAGIDVGDVAKRLMDYGFHAPTVSWPVPGTLMIEPTESESKDELDRFCDALAKIREEIQEIIDGKGDKEDNVLKNAPHTVLEVTDDNWTHPYSRSKAAFPLQFVRDNKFWPASARVDNAYGDRNLFCTCPPVESYE